MAGKNRIRVCAIMHANNSEAPIWTSEASDGPYLHSSSSNKDTNSNQSQHKLQYVNLGEVTNQTCSPDSSGAHFNGNTINAGMSGISNVKTQTEESDERPSSSHSANTSAGGLGSDGSPQAACIPASGNKSRYRGVSYDRKKAKWRVQIKVAALGKSGVSVGYFDTEESAARAYDKAAIGLLGRENPNLQTNFHLSDYANESIPLLTGKTREEVKTTLKSERIKHAPRRRFTSRQRTSRFMGVGSSNRKNQWQARILVHGKVTHLGYYETEEEAAKVYDRVSLALHGNQAQTNFPTANYSEEDLSPFRGLDREDLQRALGVKPMDKSSRFRGVSKKKGKWEAKVMVNRRWAYRELFDSEEAAARAYDRALWRLKPREAQSYVNFKDEAPVGMDTDGLYNQAPDEISEGDPAGYVQANDDDSDDDFEYEYKPTKGTSRSASMRAKKYGSAPNLAALSKASPEKSKPKRKASPAPQGTPGFVPMSGGGFQFQTNAQMNGEPVRMNASHNQEFDEPLLIRVGSETHVLPMDPLNSEEGRSTLGKCQSRLQRIYSEPQFELSSLETRGYENGYLNSEFDMLGGTHEIEDLMNDRDLFKGLDLGELTGSVAQPDDHDLQHINDFVKESTMEHTKSIGAMLFEDEELALANLEHARPRKMNKSMSMVNLVQDLDLAANVSRPPLPPTHLNPFHAQPVRDTKQQPTLRRINTYANALPSFEETDECSMGQMRSQHSSEEDLMKQLWGPNPGNHSTFHPDDIRAI